MKIFTGCAVRYALLFIASVSSISGTTPTDISGSVLSVSPTSIPANTITSQATPDNAASGASSSASSPGPSASSAAGSSASSTAGSSASSTALPSASSAAGPSASSAAGSSASSTAGSSASSTALPSASSAAGSSASSTAGSSASSTAGSSASSTALPSASSTAGSSASSTAGPSASSTAGPSASSTALPSASSTAGSSASSTAGPSASSTAGPSASSTALPSASSTAGPSASSTAGPSASSTAGPSASSTASASPSTTPDSTTPTKLPAPSSPCKSNSCGSGSSCVNLHNEYFCLCPVGQYYNNSTCTKGDIFPGTITVKINASSDLENKNSEAYQQLYNKVTEFFKNAFAQEKYGQTVILKISLSPSARSEMRAGENNVEVTVVNIFVQGKVTEKEVEEAIKKAETTSADFGNYNKQNLCEYYGCVDDSNGCRDSLQCTCKPGLERPNPQVPICVGVSTCPSSCTAERHKQCLLNTKTNTPVCTCLPGYKNDSNDICQKCSFGYSGANCEDQFQLILTIVGSIAGILILGMVITLIFVVRSKNKKKNIEKQRLIEDDFSNMRLKETGVSNFGADGNIFPKVRIGASKSSQPQNPYVNSRQLPRPDY